MLSLFLFLVLVAIVLGIIGFTVHGLLYLFFIGVLVLLVGFAVAARGMRRRRVPR